MAQRCQLQSKQLHVMLLHSNYNFGADKVADREWTIEKLLFRDQLVVSHWPGRVTLIFTWLVDVIRDRRLTHQIRVAAASR